MFAVTRKHLECVCVCVCVCFSVCVCVYVVFCVWGKFSRMFFMSGVDFCRITECWQHWCKKMSGIKVLLILLISTLTSNISFIQLSSLLSGYPASSFVVALNLTEAYQPWRSTVLEQRLGPSWLVARRVTMAMQWWLTPHGTSMPRVTPQGHYQEPLHWDRMMPFSWSTTRTACSSGWSNLEAQVLIMPMVYRSIPMTCSIQYYILVEAWRAPIWGPATWSWCRWTAPEVSYGQSSSGLVRETIFIRTQETPWPSTRLETSSSAVIPAELSAATATKVTMTGSCTKLRPKAQLHQAVLVVALPLVRPPVSRPRPQHPAVPHLTLSLCQQQALFPHRVQAQWRAHLLPQEPWPQWQSEVK